MEFGKFPLIIYYVELTLGGAGNGDYRGELLRAREVIASYATQLALPLSHVVVQMSGLYGNR